jgi:GntR family transcriptional regulator
MTTPSVSQRLHDQLSQIIAITEPGKRLPSEPELAEELGVSRATLREAMRTFETQGRIRRKQGSGTYVNHPPYVLETGLEVLESIETIAQRSRLQVTIGQLEVKRRVANPEESQTFSLEPSSEVIQVSRVILAENRPVAYLIDILPAQILDPDDWEDDFSGSILDLFIERGEPQLLSSRTEISVVTASTQVARALGIQRGDGLLCFIADLFNTDGEVIDHSYSYFLPGYFRFHVVRKIG